MKCVRCKKAEALKHKDLCGICEIVEAQAFMSELPAAVPSHFNQGLGEYIEDRDHLKKRRKELAEEGVISAWD